VRRLLGAVLAGLVILVASPVFAAQPGDALSCTASSDGLWSAAGTWTNCGGTAPDSNDSCTINANIDVVKDAAAGTCGSLTFTAGGNLSYSPATASNILTIGDGLAAGTSDNVTVVSGSSMAIGGGQLLFSTANTTGAASRGDLNVSGYFSAVGTTLYPDGTVTKVSAISGSWPDRTVTITDSMLSAAAVDQFVGKQLWATSGIFKGAAFDVVAGGTTPQEIVIRMDGRASAGTRRGQLDSRNAAGRVDPRTTGWAPGDQGEIIDGGTNSWPATITIANGASSGTLSANAPGGTARLNELVGARLICAADLNVDADPDFVVIESYSSASVLNFKTAYKNPSGCAAGGDYMILQDNQPPSAAAVIWEFVPGDTFKILDTATIGIPASSWSDSAINNPMQIHVNNGGTFVGRNLSITHCGYYVSGTAAQGCMVVSDIDNNNADEGIYLDTVEWDHFNGIAALELNDVTNATFRWLSVRDAADGAKLTENATGVCPADEGHGIRESDLSGDPVRVANLHFEDIRVVRTNDAEFLVPFQATESDGIGCTDCSVTRSIFGWAPANCGGSLGGLSIGQSVKRFTATEIFQSNVPFGYTVCNSASGSMTCSGSVSSSLFQNSIEKGPGFNSVTDASGILDANAEFYFVGNVLRNINSSTGAPLIRGRWIDNYIDPGNKGVLAGTGLVGIVSQPQEAKGNVFVTPPKPGASGTYRGALWDEPTGTGRIEPTTLREWDNVVMGPASVIGTGDSIYLVGLVGSGNDAFVADADIRHTTLVGNEDLLVGGDMVGWRFRDNGTDSFSVLDSIVFNTAYTYTRVNGTETVVGDYQLCVKVAGGCPASPMSAGANTLTAGVTGLFDPTHGDFNLAPGSTPKESLGSDGYPRGARVAGPPHYEILRTLYPFFVPPAPAINNIGDVDSDLDGVWDLFDNCDDVWNPQQSDPDGDGVGCACDAGETCP